MKLKVHELVDILTNPKWWPDGIVDHNAVVCISKERTINVKEQKRVNKLLVEVYGHDPNPKATEPVDDEQVCIAVPASHASVNPISNKIKIGKYHMILDEDAPGPNVVIIEEPGEKLEL